MGERKILLSHRFCWPLLFSHTGYLKINQCSSDECCRLAAQRGLYNELIILFPLWTWIDFFVLFSVSRLGKWYIYKQILFHMQMLMSSKGLYLLGMSKLRSESSFGTLTLFMPFLWCRSIRLCIVCFIHSLLLFGVHDFQIPNIHWIFSVFSFRGKRSLLTKKIKL